MMKKLVLYLFAVVTFAAYCSIEAKGQADFADFTYQGSLTVGGVPANGNYELTFEYFSTQTGGTTLGTFVFSGVTVTNGIFSVELPGSTSLFAPGASIWIQISAKPAGSPDAPTILTPRQRVQPSPMSISSLLSADSNKLGGVAANQYLTTTGAATTFIQNGTTQQTGGFNLNGTGTANILNAASQFNINGNRILSASGADNIFAGFQAGQSNTSGSSNAFFGVLAGSANTTGNFNSFFGRSTGISNSGGNANSFFGSGAGNGNNTGGNNSFFGADAGSTNTTGNNNTIIGVGANVGAGNLTNATALGFRSAVSQSNSLVLGGINGINGANADTNVGIGLTNPTQRLQVVGNAVFSGNVGIGTTSPNSKFELIDSGNTGLRVQTNTAGGTVASFGGFGAFRVDAPGIVGGRFTMLENGNVGIGNNNPTEKLSVAGNGAFTGSVTANGNGIFSGNVGIGTNAPAAKLDVNGTIQSSSGGFKFPDGTVQTSAANNVTYTTATGNLFIMSTADSSVLHLDLPPGTFILDGTISFYNIGGGLDARRTIGCNFFGESLIYYVAIESPGFWGTVPMHSVMNLPVATRVDIRCTAKDMEGTVRTVQTWARRFTATKVVGSPIVQ